MKTFMRIITAVIMTVVFMEIIGLTGAKADGDFKPKEYKAAVPEFKIKRINKGTGVKLIIKPTERANMYSIYITNTRNAYSKYMYNNGQDERHYASIPMNTSGKTVYTIEGLPKGTYTFKIEAYRGGDYDFAVGSESYSEEKTVKIKSAPKVSLEEKEYDFSKTKVGDVIEFGSYEQDDDMLNGPEPIEWVVLAKDKEKMLVLSKRALDTLPYHKNPEGTTWEYSTIRKWLHNIFYESAFTNDEHKYIIETTRHNYGVYGDTSGNETKDKLFFLSNKDVRDPDLGLCDEKSDYYIKDIKRRCAVTDYALAQGCKDYSKLKLDKDLIITEDGEYTCHWWINNTAVAQEHASYVSAEGKVEREGGYAATMIGVRPAMYISLKQ